MGPSDRSQAATIKKQSNLCDYNPNLGRESEGGGHAPAFRVASCQTWTGVRLKTGRKLIEINQKLSKSTTTNLLESGDVNFEFGFEW